VKLSTLLQEVVFDLSFRSTVLLNRWCFLSLSSLADRLYRSRNFKFLRPTV
jgi:hypothetical protein